MKAILRGLNMAGEIEIDRVRSTIDMSIKHLLPIVPLDDYLEGQDILEEASTKIISFRFIRQIDKDTVLYELEGWR